MAEEKEIYSLKEIKDLIRQQGYKYCSLTNQNGKSIIPFNRPVDKRMTALKKFEEIERRFPALSKGIYFVVCKNSFNAQTEGDSYAMSKGNAKLSENQSRETIIERGGDPSKVLDYKEALALAEKAMDWQRKYETQVALYNQLQGQYTALKEQTENEEGLEEEAPLKGFFESILPSFLPVVDRHYAFKEKKLALEEAKTAIELNERGLLPGRNGHATNGVKKKINGRTVPKVGTPEFETMLDKLSDADDATFEAEMMYLYKHAPKEYEAAYAELVDGAEEEEEEEQEEEENA